MSLRSDYRRKERRLADLRNATEDLERKLDSVRTSIAAELGHPASRSAGVHATRAGGRERAGSGHRHHGDDSAGLTAVMRGYRGAFAGAGAGATDEDDETTVHWRTEDLVSHGRRTYRPGRRLIRKAAIAVAAFAAFLALILAITLSGGGASWPASVATVKSEAARACQNPDVKSEPDQVNFACDSASQQILWVFALMTSYDNARFSDPETGRVGLEPITPEQGGEVALSLNLHQPYNPLNPIDSLEVAARAINSIIGGATVTAANGSPDVQPGLEGVAANCLRYTGSPALTSRKGFPSLCARPVSTAAGQAALVADVYRQWMVGATPQAAQDVAVLFQNANNPGNPQVQAILRQLRTAFS